MRTDIIPRGIYCYDHNGKCPYFSYIKIYDKLSYSDVNDNPLPPIEFPFCTYLGKGSMPNSGWDHNEFDRIQAHLIQTEDELWDDLLSLDLLWDQCKECGENIEDVYDMYERGKIIYNDENK